MAMLDSNVVLRYLLQNNQEMALQVRDKMKKATCMVSFEVVAEVAYVLVKVYGINRESVYQSLLGFFENENVETHRKNILMEAIEVYGKTKFDFVDCLMVGYAKYEGHEIITFDKKLKKYLVDLF